jgi:hypothetical protein
MRLGTTYLKSLVLGCVVALVPLVLPDSAAAYGWYHYVAWDTYHDNAWPSKEPIKRMYWHHTAGGFGVSIKCKIDGTNYDWIWVPISNNGWGGYSGSTTKYGRVLDVFVVRFNGQSGEFVPEPINDAYAWSANAYVSIIVRQNGVFKAHAEGVLNQRLGDQDW